MALAFGVFACSTPDELGPAETVEFVAHGLAGGDLSVGWDALPASYQSDMNGIAHDFAAAVDADLWNRTFAVLGKLTRLLKEKEAFILGHPFVAEHLAESAGEGADWSAVVQIIDLLVTSELANVDQLATLDVGSFLTGTGNRFLQLFIEASALSSVEHRAEFEAQRDSLLALRATLESTEGGVASVRIEVPGEDPTLQRFVRVEEKWIPADLADDWSTRIASAKESIANLSNEEMMANKPAILMQMSMVDSALDTLLAAKTAEEFNAGIGAVIGMAVGAMFNPAAMMDTSASTSPGDMGAPIVTLSIPDGPSSPASIADRFGSGGSVEIVQQVEIVPAAPAPLVRESSAEPPSSAAAHARSQVPVSEAQRYIGQTLRVVASDGFKAKATLKRIEGGGLVFEQTIGGGTMTFKLRSDEIESLSMR
jgi:hypothetical protein